MIKQKTPRSDSNRVRPPVGSRTNVNLKRVRLKPLMSFTSDGKGKTDVDMIAGEYQTVMYKYHEVDDPSLNESAMTRNQLHSHSAKQSDSSKGEKEKMVKTVTVDVPATVKEEVKQEIKQPQKPPEKAPEKPKPAV